MTVLMPTSKKRIYVTLPKDTEEALYSVAERDDVPPASKAAELIKLALEIYEDEALSGVASERDTPDATFVSHEEAWK